MNDDDVADFLMTENNLRGDGPQPGAPVSREEALAAYGYVRVSIPSLERRPSSKSGFDVKSLSCLLRAAWRWLIQLGWGNRWKL